MLGATLEYLQRLRGSLHAVGPSVRRKSLLVRCVSRRNQESCGCGNRHKCEIAGLVRVLAPPLPGADAHHRLGGYDEAVLRADDIRGRHR